jgi:hypothetical protein
VRRIIYCSQSTIDFSPEELVDLLEAARDRNAESQLSGMLLYCSQSFLQMLEGEPAELEETYGRISLDDRHNNLRLLMDTEISSRMFPDWTMGFAHIDEDELADELDGYVPEIAQPLVNPDLITSGEVAKRLLALYGENRVAR